MEGGQKYTVPLDGGLDVKSSDQLVPVSDPLFQHNRQKFQGSMLPTSLRYEHDGWACGWDVYEFEVDVTAVGTVPEGYTVIRQKFNDNPAYIFRVRSGTTVFVQIWYNAEDSDRTGGLDIAHDALNPYIVTVSGSGSSNDFELVINMVTGEIGYDSGGWEVSELSCFDATSSDGVTSLIVSDLNSMVMFNAAIVTASDVLYEGSGIASYYSCDGTVHLWKNASAGGWEISHDLSSGVTLVNGNEASFSSLDGGSGTLSITANSGYEGDVSVSVSSSASHLQIFDLDLVQLSSSSSDSVDGWSVWSRGSSFLFPTSSSGNRMYACGSVPYWVGGMLSITRSAEGIQIGSTRVGFVTDDGVSETISGNNSVYMGEGYYVSGNYVSFYNDEASAGASASFWIGTRECLAEHATSSTDFASFPSVQGKFSYCVCVLNRIIEEEGVIPFLAGGMENGVSYTVDIKAPWFAGGNGILTKEEGVYGDFQAGFYAPVALDQDSGYWKISIEGISASMEYASSEVIGNGGDFDGYARVGEPLAFYDQEAVLESWPGQKYSSSVSDTELAGSDAVGFTCSLNYDSFLQGDISCSWGYTGYILPYFYTVESGSSSDVTDSRVLDGVADTSSSSSTGSYHKVFFNTGPLARFGMTLTSSKYTNTLVSADSNSRPYNDVSSRSSIGAGTVKADWSIPQLYYNRLWWLSGTTAFTIGVASSASNILGTSGWVSSETLIAYAASTATRSDLYALRDALISPYTATYPEGTYTYSVAYRFWQATSCLWDTTQLWRPCFDYYKITISSYGVAAAVIYGDSIDSASSVIEFGSSGEEVITSVLSGTAGIEPKYAAVKLSGTDVYSVSTGESQSRLFFSVCYDGYFQSEISLEDTSNHLFTSSNFGDIFTLSKSSDTSLQVQKGFYIDRSIASYDDSGSCTMFGVNEFQVNEGTLSLSSSSVTAYLYGSPAFVSGDYADFYIYSGSGSLSSTVFIPGQVYYNNASSVMNGYNLTASSLGRGQSSSSVLFYVSGSACAFYAVDSVSVSWDAASGVHDFYSSVLPDARGLVGASSVLSYTPGHSGSGSASIEQVIPFSFDGGAFEAHVLFSMSGGSLSVSMSLSPDPASFSYRGYGFSFSIGSYSLNSVNSSILLSVSVPLTYQLSARLPYQYSYDSFSYNESAGEYAVDGARYSHVPVGSYALGYDYSSGTYSFESVGGNAYSYNDVSRSASYGTSVVDASVAGEAMLVSISDVEQISLSFILAGAYAVSGDAEIVSFGNGSIAFRYNGTEYSFDMEALMSDEAKNQMAFMYTDTTDADSVPKGVTFAVQNTESEYQFLRQQWNTLVEVENYWWIDENTILELNKTSLAVKRKVSSFGDYDEESDVDIDDWGGDAWRIAYSFDRWDYIDNTVARYGVTCAYGGALPLFWTVKLYSSSIIRITFYSLSGSDYSWSMDGVSVDVPVNVVSIGQELNASEKSINTYSQLSAATIIYEAKYSGTVIGSHVLFGIHLDNNFNQWALDILASGSLNAVVQGYGFVGIDGRLTGGEIPSAHFNPAVGFTGTVLPIDEIEQEDIEYSGSMSEFIALDADGKVIGDESQQWYIAKSLSGIVSHLTWNGESWDAVSLPVSNNYECCYGSPSYGRRVISDFSLWIQKLSQLIDDDSFQSAVADITDILTTLVYGYSPKITTALYLQQTAGQYAYVHYNSMAPGKQRDLSREDASENIFGDEGVQGDSYTALGIKRSGKETPIEAVSPENSDDFTFNLHGARQSISIENPWGGTFGIMLVIMCGMSSFTSALSGVVSSIKVNAEENKISAKDIGKEFGQFFLYNMDNLSSMDFKVIGVLPSMQSAVGIACTLDMFYSTSEGQRVRAGPGWVQHNMIAQCVAQSVTSCQWEMQQIGMLWIIEGVSALAAKTAFIVAELTWDMMKAQANALKEATAAGSNYGYAGAVALILTGSAVVIAASVYNVLAEATDAIVHSICGGSAKVEVQNASSKHIYDVEGKHRYGQKSEVFMWPCFGVSSPLEYTDETVSAEMVNHEWNLNVPLTSGQSFMSGSYNSLGTISFDGFLGQHRQDDDAVSSFDGDIAYLISNCRGSRASRTLPSDMAAVIGTDSFLPPVPFRNENIGTEVNSFPTPCFQDYIVDKDWELSLTAGDGMVTWVSCKDTKLIDGEYSNIVVSDDFCGVASPYCAIEVKRGCEQKYVRPWAITPNALALNQTGYNCCYDRKAYHAFDGYGQRLVKWCGAAGMNKEGVVAQYAFIVNDRFKRSNRIFRNEFYGNFRGDPIIALRTTGDDEVYNHVTYLGYGDAYSKGYEVGAVGEDKDTRRYAVPVFSELVSTLPAAVKTITSVNLSVIDGITSLTTDNRDLQSAYKAPVSVDFSIGDRTYRFTEEYICSLEVDKLTGVTIVSNVVPVLGLSYLGSTPHEAYLYSKATRQYYSYSGGDRIEAVDTLERFRDVLFGRYDFVNQDVAVPCVATFKRLDKHVHDDEDERDNVIVPILRNGTFAGEVAPPIGTIYNMRSGFKTISLPSGLCYQGPNRCIINRFVYSDYMKGQIVENYGKWRRVPRERYHPFRDYGVEYERVDESAGSQLVGWTHNPFLLVTSPLGVGSETDCVYEWEITFAWPVEMDELYGCGQYAVVNIMGECFAPGGKSVPDRPAHVFLWRDLFTRTGNYGYYSFRYQSRCGAGNRERLHIWSDQYIAVSGLRVDVKPVTEKRTEVLTQQADVQDMKEI